MEKAAALSATSRQTPTQPAPGTRPISSSTNYPLATLQRTLGNQAMLDLLESGGIRAKLRVSQPGDPDEQEADRAADQVVATTYAPKIQRKCACEGTGSPCAKCEEEETGAIHRSVLSPSLRSFQLSVQRAPASDSSAKTPDQAGNPPKSSPTPAHTHPLVVEDDAKSVGPHQMRKSAFIALLRSDACATADAVLISVGHTTKSCPYIEKWLAFYEKQSSDHIERAILKYAPETANARSAHEAIRLVVMRVQRAAMTWAKTGKVTGLPEDLASQLPGQGFLGAVHSFASSSVGGAILGFLGGSKPEKSAADTAADKSPAATVSRKTSDGHPGVAPAHDARAVRSQLGSGHSLDSKTQSQMSSAFGHDFSAVRIHTDARASSLSSDLDARAFTIGTDVAFASGEYRPGTPVGDALIAHELAHVIQQSAATRSPSPMQKAADGAATAADHGASQLENDADLCAVGAVASIWAGAKHGLAGLRASAIPRLRSGLRIQRCGAVASEVKRPEPTAATAAAIISSAKDQSKGVEDRAKEVVRSIIRTYYPGDAEKVVSVEYDDARAANGLEVEEVFSPDRDRSKIKGKIFVGRRFFDGVNEIHFARRVLQVGHELEHIAQFRDPSLTPVRNPEERRRRKDEREFLAFYHEAVGMEKPGTGTVHPEMRIALIDAALRYYNCLTDDRKARYLSRFNELTSRRAREVGLTRIHFGPAPTQCERPSG